MTWTMIILVLTPPGPASLTAPFNTRADCVAATEDIVADIPFITFAWCVSEHHASVEM